MNAKARAWVAELRSGKWKQVKGQLRHGNKFCCLGVACEMYRRKNGGQWRGVDKDEFMGTDIKLPGIVRKWLSLRQSEGQIGRSKKFLSRFNDSGKSFSEIADIIEQNADRLFVGGKK